MMDNCPVIQVKIGDIVDPRTMWVYPYKRFTTNLIKVRNIEAMMQQISSQNSVKINKLRPAGTLVAVRQAGKWFRGKIVDMFVEKVLRVNVFLIDYGTTVTRVSADQDVRVLDSSFSQEAGAAFQVVLSGLSPVTMDVDWSLSSSVMSVTPAESWTPAALAFVRAVVKEANHEAELVDYVVDSIGRRHGQLLLPQKTVKIHLNEVLVEKKFAGHSREKYENDLMEFDLLSNDDCSSIVEGSAPSEIMLPASSPEEDSSKIVTLEDFEKDRQANDEYRKSLVVQPRPSQLLYKPHRGSMSRGRGRSSVSMRDFNKSDHLSSLVKISDFKKSNIESESNSNKLLSRLRRSVCINKAPVEVVDDWATVRDKRDKTRDDDTKFHQLPGGVFIGKYHEAVVSHLVRSDGDDLKTKFEKFVELKK